MKRKPLHLLLSTCLLWSMSTAKAQQDLDNSSNNMPAPQIWSFVKYGQHTPSLYTGTVTASIPIYVYKDPDFEIPISLEYASNGYIPNVQASSAGLGWYLSAGGTITRNVQGIRDDLNNYMGGYGFYKALSTNTTLPTSAPDLFRLCEPNQYDNLKRFV